MDQLDFYFEGVLFPSLKRPFIILRGALLQDRGTVTPHPYLPRIHPRPAESLRQGCWASAATWKRSKLSVLKMLERFHCEIMFPEMASTSIEPISTSCGNHYYLIFSAFGIFPAVRCQSICAFRSHDFQKKEVNGISQLFGR